MDIQKIFKTVFDGSKRQKEHFGPFLTPEVRDKIMEAVKLDHDSEYAAYEEKFP